MEGSASLSRLLRALVFAAVAVAALAAASPGTAPAARPMLIGFQDDPGFRWSSDRRAMLADAARAHATIVRATAN